MKKFFQSVGLIALVLGSFFYTEKTVSVVKEMDEVMVQIEAQARTDKKDAQDASIDGNTIIPGISGKQVDVDLSYQKMKQYGSYDAKLLQYETVKPTNSILNYYDKYIVGGNHSVSKVSILFLVEEESDIEKIDTLVKKEAIHVNYFIDGNWLEKNNDRMIQMIQDGNVIGNLSYHRDYTDSSFVWMNTIISRIGNQKIGYCYTEKQDKAVLENCKLQKKYTILPNLIAKEHPLMSVKEEIQPGSMISLPVNQVVEEQLTTIIRYIKSKGYKIVTLTELLEE